MPDQQIAPTDRDGQPDGDLLTPEQWIRFGDVFGLSGRELEITVPTTRDLPRKAIAQQLHLSIGAVHTYCDRLHKKLNAKDRVALLLRIIQFLATELSAQR